LKKDIKKLFLLGLVLTIISTIVILSMGKTIEYSFNVKNNDCKISLDNDNGELEIIEKPDNKCAIKVKSNKAGRSYLTIDYGDYVEQKILYIHKSFVITDNTYFGYSTGSEIIPISISIFSIYILILLIKRYKKYLNENIYQYKNVSYLGIIIFLSLFIFNNISSIFSYQGMFDTINETINSISAFSFFMFPIALITFILVTISNIKLLKKEGKSLKNLLGVFLGIFICILTVLPEITYRILLKSHSVDIYNLNSIGPYLYNFIESLVYLIVSYLECILLGTIIVAIKSAKKVPKYNKDYIIILGCQIRKDGTLTPLLKGRVDKAIEFRNNQLKETGKDLIFITSGGKGNDEIISEAEAMEKYLLDNGIDEKKILIDDKSSNTYENIKFSNKLIKSKNANVAFSTTNYHVFRAGLLATSQGLILEGIGSKTKAYFWINAFIREFIGTLYSEKKKHIIVFLVILINIMVMIAITYLANNL